MKAPPHYLQEEGFFDFVTSAVRHIAPVVLKVAPTVISAINPTVGGIIKNVLGQDSAMAGDPMTPTANRARDSEEASYRSRAPRVGHTQRVDGTQRLGNAPQLRSQRSLASLRRDDSGALGSPYEGLGSQGTKSRGSFRQIVNYSRPVY